MANTYSTTLARASSQSWTTGASSTLNLTTTCTVEFWRKATSNPSSGTVYGLITRDDAGASGANRSWWIDYYNNGGTLQLRAGIQLDGLSANFTYSTYNYTFSVGTWTHVAITMDAAASTKFEFYINGSFASNGTQSTVGVAPTSFYNPTTPFKIGTYHNNSIYDDAQFDEVRFWNTKRTSSEISTNYNTEISASSSGLVGYWQMENNGNDSTSNALNLTGNNSPTFTTDVPFGGGGGGPTLYPGLLIMTP